MNFLAPMPYRYRYFTKLFWGILTLVVVLVLVPDLAEAQQAKTYNEAMAKGDKLMKAKRLFDAKAYYQMALRYHANDALAIKKIREIVDDLKRRESREEKYYNIIDRADAYLENDALDKALLAYENALKVMPDDDYALKKLVEIKKRLAEEKKKLADYQRALKKGGVLLGRKQFQQAIDAYRQAQHFYPKNPLAGEKIKLANAMWKSFNAKKEFATKEVKAAEQFMKIQAYDKALIHFRRADSALPGQEALIAKINALRPKAKKLSAYKLASEAADRLYVAKNYLAARLKYEAAAKLRPESQYPAEMIDKIDIRMAEQHKNLEANYRLALKQADSLFNKQELGNARAQYQMALNLKNNETYPRQQINKIDKIKQAELEKLQAGYARLIKHADSLFRSRKYLAARDVFEQAVEIKPSDIYPQKQLKEIEKRLEAQAARDKLNGQYQSLLAEAGQLTEEGNYDLAISKYQQAGLLKPKESYPANKITAVRKLIARVKQQKERDEKFKNQLALGKNLQNDGRLADARKAFELALKIKPGESFPLKQIHSIDSLIRKKEMQARLDADYRKAMSKGNEFLKHEAYSDALTAFKKAAGLKPEESLPITKIQLVNAKLASVEKARKLQKAYDELIAKAENLLKQEKYELAKGQFEKALAMKSGEGYPKQKISEINTMLVRLEKEKDQRYAEALSEADSLFNIRNFQKARSQYDLAQSIKPSETYPVQQIEICKQALAVQLKQKKAAYALAIADADKLYAAKIFDKAIHAYERAEKAVPSETYPGEMIRKITRFIEENAVQDIVHEKILVAAGQTKKFSFDPIRVDVRKKNYVLISARNVDGKSFRIIFTYGKDKTKNGGFVVEVPKGKALHDFIIRIGNQYKWFSQDNNWFSVYPGNHPLEINLVRVSKSN